MFRFANPTYLYLLLLIPVLVAIYILLRWRMRKQLRRFGDVRLMAHLMPDVSRVRVHLKFSLMMLALAFVIFIMARPQFGTRNEEVKRSGIEVVIACDVSNSMLCQDINPSRLDKAKMIVSKLIEQFDQDKVGLVAYAGSAITLLPMTADYVSAKLFLDQLNPSTVAIQGTNMAEAINRSLLSFSDKKNVGKALILITDAEDHEEGAIEMAKEARKAGVQIFVLSVGTEKGGPIPMGDGSYKKDLSGNVVTTKLNERVGKEIAKAGNGLYIRADQSNQAQNILDAEIRKMQKDDISMSMYSEYDEQFIAVAILLLLVLIAECCIMERRSPFIQRLSLFSRTPKSLLLAVAFLSMSSVMSAQTTERDYIRKGNREFRGGQLDKAETNYLKSLEHSSTFEGLYNLALTYLLQGMDSTAVAKMMDADSIGTDNQMKRAKNFHNLGNVWYAQGSYLLKSNQDATSAFQNAVNLYKSSLRCNPSDNETRYNLAKAQYQLKKSQQQQNNQNQQQQQQQQEEQKKQDEKKDQKQDEQQQQQPKPQQQKNDMSEQTAEQLLNSAQQDEKDVQRKIKQQNATSRSLEKDW
ncbi:MAG: VWA domain-containing protein [Bacteroidaceae bacterium]|nr:VWA domain-containing protein [Bacteroidaceae bacterium]MBP5523315.1 VWA domain-containing protein [Bacteroidaceae bacterium]MBQ4380185.1 VWA domain-containing protein [Bacteroidaceae bacterium]